MASLFICDLNLYNKIEVKSFSQLQITLSLKHTSILSNKDILI